jgi:hypothetical protein
VKIRSTAGTAGLLCSLVLAVPAFAAGPADVTLRVEGQSKTLLAKSKVTTTTTAVSKDGTHSCPGTSAIGALDTGTAGDWGGNWSFGSQVVETIKSETHAFDANASANYYWTFWLNYAYQNQGACDTELQAGDEVLFFPDCFGDCPTAAPLRLELPATAVFGESIKAKVTEYSVSFDENYTGNTTAQPSAGAKVEVGDKTYTTDANGIATIPAVSRGPVSARATKDPFVRTATETACVTDGADGFCGTTKPGDPPAPPAPACASTGDDGLCGTRDRRAPQASIAGITSGERFTTAASPRELAGTVSADPSGLFAVKLKLTRRYRGRCYYFSAKADGFVRSRCGRAFPFKIGDRADWSYLLPQKLGPGRYVLDVIAIDRAFNRDTLARGRNRVVFTVA